VTNYQSTTYYVEDLNNDSAAFTPLTDNGSHALKMWRTAFLPDGQPVEVSVLFTDDDVRGLQAFLNDQFGRGKTAGAVSEVPPLQVGDLVTAPGDGGQVYQQVITDPGGRINPTAWSPVEAQRAAEELGGDQAAENFLTGIKQASDAIQQMQMPDYSNVTVRPDQLQDPGSWPAAVPAPEAQPHTEPRQCPHISNGVQCSAAEGHDFGHQFVVDWATQQAAGSAPGVAPTEAPSPSLLSADPDEATNRSEGDQPVKKKVNRRKKEEIAYDKALETFRKNPNSQLEYTELVKAAEALRKRFPDTSRLEAYDEHVRLQNIDALLNPQNLANHRTPEEQAAWEASQKPVDGPHFAPEQPTEMRDPVAGRDYMSDSSPVPITLPAPQDVTPEETAAAQAFPCQHISEISQRTCIRAAGHEIANPPKPHIYAPLPDGQELPRPDFVPPVPPAGFTSTPIGTPAQDGSDFTQATIPPFQIPQPPHPQIPQFAPPGTINDHYLPEGAVPQQPAGATVLSFQIPPTPETADVPPPAPAAPPWGGQ
jgi:hypothetical protein